MRLGIDRLSCYTSRYFLDTKTLATRRNVDYDKYALGLGQKAMSVAAPGEDVVTLGANAALPLCEEPEALSGVEWLIFATESGVDASKAAGLYVHRLLGLPSTCRVVEVKQACYGSTAALQMALAFTARFPEKKVLVIAADIARYGLNTPGEVTQGCGAAAFLVSAHPRLLVIHKESGVYTEDVMDFWRPPHQREALVDGKLSTRQYIKALLASWKDYERCSGRKFGDFAHYCYHLPFPRMAEKAHLRLAHANRVLMEEEALQPSIADSLHYSRLIGNSYTASLFIGLASLLDHAQHNLSGQCIGMFSYGSGCVGEFFSGIAAPSYRDYTSAERHRKLMTQRSELTYEQYEDFYRFVVPQDKGCHYFPDTYETGSFRLAGIEGYKPIYERVG